MGYHKEKDFREPLRAQYVSYDGALDSLVFSRIILYLIGLSRKGIQFTLLTYERSQERSISWVGIP